MLILLPIDKNEFNGASLAPLNDVKKFALLDYEEALIKEIEYFDTHEEIEKWVDIVVVSNDNEHVWPFMEKQITVLVAHHQKRVEDVLEAYLFKELHEISF